MQRNDPVRSDDYPRDEEDFVDDQDDNLNREEELDEDLDEDFLNAKLNFFNRSLTGGFIEGLKDSPPETNLTRIQPTVKRLPVEPHSEASNAILEFDWDLDPAEDKHKWHHKKKKKKKVGLFEPRDNFEHLP